MMGSASCWRSYGLTHGSMLPQAQRLNASAMATVTLTAIPVVTAIVIYLGLLLFEQRSDLIQILAFVAGLVAAVQVANIALAIDEHGARHGAHVVQLAHLAVAVEQHREGHRRFLQPAFSILGVRFHVHAHQGEAERTVALVHLFE